MRKVDCEAWIQKIAVTLKWKGNRVIIWILKSERKLNSAAKIVKWYYRCTISKAIGLTIEDNFQILFLQEPTEFALYVFKKIMSFINLMNLFGAF